MNKKKKILIVGNLYALAHKLSKEVEKVYVVPGNPTISEFAECVDIRENNIPELLNFVLENDIDLTIAISKPAIKADIAGIFQANEKLVFAPLAECSEFITSYAQAKRFLYKLHAPTPKFGIFEKLPIALDYLKNANYPLIISNDNRSKAYCCTTLERAKFYVENLFNSDESKIIIEEFVYGTNFTLYCVTDGYHALPITTVNNYIFTENGDGGHFTSGIGCYTPAYKVSFEVEQKIFNEVILKVLNYTQKNNNAYLGIIAVNAIETSNGEFCIRDFKHFMEDFDAQAVLNLVEEDLINLFEACANGFFADEYEDIMINNMASVACMINSRKNIQLSNMELLDSDINLLSDNNISTRMILTATAKTISRAKEILKEDIDIIKFNGMKYRSDIVG